VRDLSRPGNPEVSGTDSMKIHLRSVAVARLGTCYFATSLVLYTAVNCLRSGSYTRGDVLFSGR
jgi:hypothetical protein